MIDLIKPFPGESEDSFAKRNAYYIRILRPRLLYGENLIKLYTPNGVPITESEKEEIDAFWTKFLEPKLREKLVDYQYYNVFKNVINDGQRLSSFIPDTFYYAYVDDYFTNPQHSNPCDDKNLYDLYFYDVNKAKTLFRKVNGLFLDDNYSEISQKQAISIAKENPEIVIKVAKWSEGGKGILFWNSIDDDESKLLDFLMSSNNLVCQEVIRQHQTLSELNPTSINTIRLMTFVFEDKVYMLSSFIRFGAHGNRMDNVHSGGFACGLQKDGQLKKYALDLAGTRYEYKPNGKPLDQFKVPNYEKCVEMATRLARRFASVSRLISWDLAIDEMGNPLVVEFNITFGGINFHQLCNGPLFGELTESVLEEVFRNSYTLKSIIKSFQ